jgi:hypothetical protein
MSSQTVAAPGAVRRASDWIGTVHARVAALRPLYVLSALLATQWVALAILAVTVRHNGWIYYMGGDQLWHYSSGYLLAHRELPPTLVGYGWATLLAPITWFTGPDLVNALPVIVLLNTLVLLPVALLAMYGIGARLGGRVFGYWVTLLWVLLPYFGIVYALHGYHQKYTELTLPQVLGLGAMSDFPSVVALMVAAYLCLRAIDELRWHWAAAAGFGVGCTIAIKPSNTVFVIAPLLLFAIYRRRALVPGFLGSLPPLIVLTFWKVRGYGNLPAFAHAGPVRRVALGSGGIFGPFDKYTGGNSWTQLHNNLLQLREWFWSDRLLEFAVVGGLIVLLVRNRRAGIFVGVWFFAFLLLKGTYLNSRVEDATFWRLMLPAFPAFVLLLASIPAAFPGVRFLQRRVVASRTPRWAVIATVATAAVLFVLFPFTLIAAAKPIHLSRLSSVELGATLVPVPGNFATAATPEPNGVLLQWRPMTSKFGRTFYRVFRAPPSAGLICNPSGSCSPAPLDVQCRQSTRAPDRCTYPLSAIQTLGSTRESAWLDRPPVGTWIYRIGVAANWLDDPSQGDVYVLGPPVQITVPKR